MKKRFAMFCCLAMLLCLFPSSAFATSPGDGNLDGGGGGMGQGTSTNKWIPGNDGVRITVVNAETGSMVAGPVDFSNRDLTPDNPASVTFRIMGRNYRVNNVVISGGDEQVVWVKWRTPPTPQTINITVSVRGAYTAQDTFVAKIVDLNEKIPPDPLATDTNPGYSIPSLPSNPQKLTAYWGVWSCYWIPVWDWCDHDDWGHWVANGYWEYDYTGYSASISGSMSLMPDDIVPTASGKQMKSGYGVKTDVRAVLSTSSPTSHFTNPQTAFCSGSPAAAAQNLLFGRMRIPPTAARCISPRYGSRMDKISRSIRRCGTPGSRMECSASI